MHHLTISALDTAAEAAVLALNDANVQETSPLDQAELRNLVAEAFYAKVAGSVDAFLLAFDQHAAYGSPNFLWFKARHPRFVYIDRIIVAPHARGRGLARLLYADLFEHARAAGHDRIVCEVNVAPPNPASDAFHAALGFTEEGRATLPDNGKVVRYLSTGL
jgi:predicted GNAT superfamily acetyltransferase